jgi:hypothetical protein
MIAMMMSVLHHSRDKRRPENVMRRLRSRVASQPSPRASAVLVAGALALAGAGLVGPPRAPAPRPPGATVSGRGAASSKVPPLYLGLDSYLNLDKLSYLEIGDRADGQSTADPGGSNAVIHGSTLFDQVGPGIVTFMRMQQTMGSPWQLTDDGRQMTITPSDLGGTDPFFPYPLSLNPSESQGSSIIATALPFRTELTVTAQSENGNFYSIYRKLPYGSSLPALNPSQTERVAALLRSAGRDIAPAGISSAHGVVTLGAANEPTALVDLNGRYQIRALKLEAPFADKVQLGNSILRIYWNGNAVPAVNAPIKYLAGDGAGVYQPAGRQLVQGLLANTTSDGKTYLSYNLYYPMPFASSARIVIVPGSATAARTAVRWSVQYEPFAAPASWWGTFHANYTTIPHPRPGLDMTFLDYRGSGKLVGTVVNFGAIGTVLEGNPQIYLDNSKTPQIAGTGTEEWGLGGDYWNNGIQVSLPLGGLPSANNNPPGANVDGAAEYRFLIADSIPFNSRIIVDWEHGSVNQATGPFSASMMWYGTPRQTAVQSDGVFADSPASLRMHHYHSPGDELFALTAAYEYLPYAPLIAGTVAEMKSASTFVLKVDPANVGAFLRRTFDSCIANQRAAIYIDGEFAGTWYDPGASPGVGYDGHLRCWRDEDFPLPAALTMGKSSVTVRIVDKAGDAPWTAADYEMYSFVI